MAVIFSVDPDQVCFGALFPGFEQPGKRCVILLLNCYCGGHFWANLDPELFFPGCEQPGNVVQFCYKTVTVAAIFSADPDQVSFGAFFPSNEQPGNRCVILLLNCYCGGHFRRILTRYLVELRRIQDSKR